MTGRASIPQFRFDRILDIPGIKREASAITFNPVTGNLLVVSDEPAVIVEFTTDGDLVRKVKLRGFKDTEGLCHLGEHRFGVAEERKKRITVIDIPPGEKEAYDDGFHVDLQQVKIKRNKGLEGVTYDGATDTLYAAREDHPPTVFRIHPFLGNGDPEVAEVSLELSGLKDLSDLYFDSSGPWLWTLSHESRAAWVFDEGGDRVAQLSFEKESLGLPETIPQAEGITRDGAGRLYICTEPDTIYRFTAVVDLRQGVSPGIQECVR